MSSSSECTSRSSSSMEADEDGRENPIASPATYKRFRQKPISWSTISIMLSQVNVPYHFQPFMIWKISKAVESIALAMENANLSTVLVVVLKRLVAELSDLEFPELSDSGTGEDEEGERGNRNSVCVICLEEILVGRKEVVSMPCSHVYHGDCIVDWLRRSRACPLCRFQMVSESTTKGWSSI